MASIRKRGDSYQITVSNGRDSNNKQILITETYYPKANTPKKIEKEVNDYARDLERRVKEGKYFSGETMTFDECVKIWDQEWASKKLTPSIREKYLSTLNNKISGYIGRLPIAKIKAKHIQPIYNDMEELGRTASTIHTTHIIVNSVFKYAYRMEIIENNPCDRCFVPKVEQKHYQDIHFFTVDQAKIFLDAISMEFDSDRSGSRKTIKGAQYDCSGYSQHIKPRQPKLWRAYFYLAIYGGFRRGELIALNWDRVDFEEMEITIDKSATRTKEEGQTIKKPKTLSSIRTIKLPAECFEILDEWRREQLRIWMKMGTAWNSFGNLPEGDRPVFTQLESGKRMDLATPSHKFKSIIERYNETAPEEKKLPEIRLHDLRHTSATLLLSNLTDIETVSHRLGHSKASVTLDVYGHWTKEADETASQKLAELFG